MHHEQARRSRLLLRNNFEDKSTTTTKIAPSECNRCCGCEAQKVCIKKIYRDVCARVLVKATMSLFSLLGLHSQLEEKWCFWEFWWHARGPLQQQQSIIVIVGEKEAGREEGPEMCGWRDWTDDNRQQQPPLSQQPQSTPLAENLEVVVAAAAAVVVTKCTYTNRHCCRHRRIGSAYSHRYRHHDQQ